MGITSFRTQTSNDFPSATLSAPILTRACSFSVFRARSLICWLEEGQPLAVWGRGQNQQLWFQSHAPPLPSSTFFWHPKSRRACFPCERPLWGHIRFTFPHFATTGTIYPIFFLPSHISCGITGLATLGMTCVPQEICHLFRILEDHLKSRDLKIRNLSEENPIAILAFRSAWILWPPSPHAPLPHRHPKFKALA